MKMKILHTNDMHSCFENFARVTTAIRRLRDENTLVLDAGDFNDFRTVEMKGTDGEAGVELLKIAGYDAMSIGNNETTEGTRILEAMARKSEVPFVSCNLRKKDMKPLGGVRRSMIIERGGLRCLVIGASPTSDFYELFNFATVEFMDAIRREMNVHRGAFECCILLSHLGMEENRIIAENIDGIDLIIAGHTHVKTAQWEKTGNTIISICPPFGETLGCVEVDVDDKRKMTSCSCSFIHVMEEQPDGRILESLNDSRERAVDKLGVPLFHLNSDLWHDVMEENPITNLLADALRDALKADIGIINSGVLNGGVRRGTVSELKLIQICPSPLNPTKMQLLGKSIKDALQKSMVGETCLLDGRGSGFRGKYLGRLHVSGAIIEHDGRHVQRVVVDGKEMQDDQWYVVATSDYLQRGSGYESLGDNKNHSYDVEFLRDTLRQYLNSDQFVHAAMKDRWINTSK